MKYYSILSSLGLAPSRLCLCGIHGFCSPRLALASPPPLAPTKRVPPCVEPMTLKSIEFYTWVPLGHTHGGRALWVLAGEDSLGQAWGNRTRGSHRDKALRGQAPKRTILSSTSGYQSQGCYIFFINPRGSILSDWIIQSVCWLCDCWGNLWVLERESKGILSPWYEQVWLLILKTTFWI